MDPSWATESQLRRTTSNSSSISKEAVDTGKTSSSSAMVNNTTDESQLPEGVPRFRGEPVDNPYWGQVHYMWDQGQWWLYLPYGQGKQGGWVFDTLTFSPKQVSFQPKTAAATAEVNHPIKQL